MSWKFRPVRNMPESILDIAHCIIHVCGARLASDTHHPLMDILHYEASGYRYVLLRQDMSRRLTIKVMQILSDQFLFSAPTVPDTQSVGRWFLSLFTPIIKVQSSQLISHPNLFAPIIKVQSSQLISHPNLS